MSTPKLRIARPTDDLERVTEFYRDGLGLAELAAFEDHAGVDGVMLGIPGVPYHLEFTRMRGARAGRAPTHDNLLVYYLPEADRWREAMARMKTWGAEPVASANPYWDVEGVTFEDPDGYRVVLQNSAWPL